MNLYSEALQSINVALPSVSHFLQERTEEKSSPNPQNKLLHKKEPHIRYHITFYKIEMKTEKKNTITRKKRIPSNYL